MVYVGKNVYKCTLYLCNVSKFKKCRKKVAIFKNEKKLKKVLTLCRSYNIIIHVVAEQTTNGNTKHQRGVAQLG